MAPVFNGRTVRVRLDVRLQPDLALELRTRAVREHISVGAVVRRLLSLALERQTRREADTRASE
jgi:plasmid stability protein